jgi:hypothetical protein
MRSILRLGVQILLAFRRGIRIRAHFGDYTRIPGTSKAAPWLNLFLSDRALLALRAKFRPGRPERIEDVEG